MSQRFVRCAHCGLPHGIDEAVCAITGRPIEARRSRAPVPQASSRSREPVARPAQPAAQRPFDAPSRGGMPAAARIPSSNPPPFAGLTSAPPPPLIGQILGGKYRAIRVLGEGGMGTVYECEHVQLHRKVAVKVLHPTQAKKKASVARFQNEAHVAGAIGHPNICEIYDMGELEDSSPFLVMELLQGETLADRIASEGALPFDDIIDVIGQVLSGLIAAHDKGIIHRDIKPENVFLTQRAGLPPMVKLLDFGISKMSGADDLHLTRTGMVMGTPFYMSPEQARGDRNLDSRVDLYATGVMMYECLTGRRPYHAANYNALLMQILTTDPRPPHDIRPAVPEAFEQVVARAMVRDRDKRYHSASEFQRDVQLLRDPGTMRRVPSVPPEPMPLVAQRRRDEPLPPSRPKPVEFPAVSIDIEGRDLLDSGAVESGASGSIEIPIVAEAPVSSRESRALYKPDPELEALARSKSLPPSVPRPASSSPPSNVVPRPVEKAPSSAPKREAPPASVPVARKIAEPSPSVPVARKVAAPPPIPPREKVQPPPAAKADRYKAPTPTALDMRKDDAPWLDDHDADPTEIGSIFGTPRMPSDTPIDADSTERIPPERLARLHDRLPRGARETFTSEKDPRAEPAVHSPNERLTTDRFELQAVERPSDDEAPTTLFDRSVLRAKLAKKSKSGANPPVRPGGATDRAPGGATDRAPGGAIERAPGGATDRAPAPPAAPGPSPIARPPGAPPLAPPSRLRGPKDT
ncbi:MAG: protein kinase [Deltaproteobacteria bacterium]|nr:protein kinase [Deltaproteobacteria bacterium]